LLALSASTSYIITIATNSKTPINIRVTPQAKWKDGQTIITPITSRNINIDNTRKRPREEIKDENLSDKRRIFVGELEQ